MVAVLSDREMVTMMFVVSHVDPGGGDLLYRTAGGHHHGRHTERDRVGGNIMIVSELSLPGDVVEETEHWR